MNIVKANEQDIISIMQLIKENIKQMESEGIFQWNEHYPTQEIFEEDIKNETLYLIKNHKDCIGIVVFDEVQSPEYKEIKWNVKNDNILVIHRFAVNPKYQKQGIGRLLINFVESNAREKNYTAIRLDAYSGNPRTLRFYENGGYKNVGQILFPYRELPFYCYEKGLRIARKLY